MSEKEVERKLVEVVKQRGGICPKWVSPGFNGAPDRIVLLPMGGIGFVEVKALGKKLRPLQAARHGLLERLGFLVFTLDSAEDIESVLDRIADGNGCICDDCETGRKEGCGHAHGRHYDAWGEGLGKPDCCPQNTDELPW